MTRSLFISPQEVAEVVGVTRRTVYEWTRKDKLRSIKVGGSVRISESALAEIIGDDAARQVFDRCSE